MSLLFLLLYIKVGTGIYARLFINFLVFSMTGLSGLRRRFTIFQGSINSLLLYTDTMIRYNNIHNWYRYAIMMYFRQNLELWYNNRIWLCCFDHIALTEATYNHCHLSYIPWLNGWSVILIKSKSLTTNSSHLSRVCTFNFNLLKWFQLPI